MSHGSPPQSAVDLHRVSPGLPFQEPSPPHSLSHHGVESPTSEKVPNLACFFCRSRKIACGRPMDGGPCNQCTKRGNKCVYPIGSRRGQHKRGTPLPKKQNNVGHMGLNVGFGF
ncbi:hypothetical protein BDZ89DRAFT_1056558 [Hymenopellis radicata]|nr:hypothetical protein BDZ89DRAFT_1056558 [Hymenopellis radicata]